MRDMFRNARQRLASGKRLARDVPALACIALVATGAALVYLPAGLIVAGVGCGLLDWRL